LAIGALGVFIIVRIFYHKYEREADGAAAERNRKKNRRAAIPMIGGSGKQFHEAIFVAENSTRTSQQSATRMDYKKARSTNLFFRSSPA
jgi:hypothetical protein